MTREAGRDGRGKERYGLMPARVPAIASEWMVASSQGTATRAGERMLERGGNAVDAVIAAAAALAVTEPMSTGVGGDLFAIVSMGKETAGLDAAGAAPAVIEGSLAVDRVGTRSVTVPGGVGGWAALSARYGRLGLDTCLADAIDLAERGFSLGARAAHLWRVAEVVPDGWSRAPRPGTVVTLPDLGRTLRLIAEHGPSAIYEGEIAAEIARSCWLSEGDLAAYRPGWVRPLELVHRGHRVLELPAPTQGVAVLEALGLTARLGTGVPEQAQAMRLSLQDAFRCVRDGADVQHLLEEAHLDARAAALPSPASEPGGGTVYLCAVDGDRAAVSLVQSIYGYFGSGVLVPNTGIVLNNRVACFEVEGQVSPSRRPYHTIIPGMLATEAGATVGPFGVMGGFIQAQAHLQFLVSVLEDGLDPQAALDRPRFRIEGDTIHLEPGLEAHTAELRALGFTVVESTDTPIFGGGQAIFCEGDHLLGGSDARKDGYAGGR